MAKKNNSGCLIVILLILVLLLGGYIIRNYILGSNPEEPPKPPIEEVDPPVQNNEDTPDVTPEPTVKEIKIICRFEGKMDENSFEATEVVKTYDGSYKDGDVLELRAGNDKIKQAIDIAEIGETVTVYYTVNDDNQYIATQFIFNN